MSEELIRTKTGIQELDKALNGGIPSGNIVLIAGGAGTGKSTFCLQFAINGASLFGEKALYISTEQNKKELYKQASGFGWDVKGLEERQLLKIIYFDVTEGDSFLEKVDIFMNDFKPKRVVVDSLTTLTDSLLVSGVSDSTGFSMVQIGENVNPMPKTEQVISKGILYKLFKQIKKYEVTVLLTTELFEHSDLLSADGVSEFIADGVVLMHFLGVGGLESRSLQIRKMRYSNHTADILQYKLSDKGIVFEKEEDISKF